MAKIAINLKNAIFVWIQYPYGYKNNEFILNKKFFDPLVPPNLKLDMISL